MNSILKGFVVLSTIVLSSVIAFAQTSIKDKEEVPKGWHLKDKAKDGYHGISLDQAYELVKDKKSKTVIVAVIDSGVDTLHEDLKPVLWRNPKEIPGNGKDDDKNGYTDDIYGWNFIGGKDGRNVKTDSYEAARVYHKFKAKYEDKEVNVAALSKEEKEEYETWKKAKNDVVGEVDLSMLEYLKTLQANLIKGDSIVRKEMGKEEYQCTELETFSSSSPDAIKVKLTLLALCKANNSMEISNVQILDELGGEIRKMEAVNTPPKNYRAEIVKDNYADFNDRFYGNNDVMANTPLHGTHVSGIIAAARNNKLGIDGVADNVKIMSIRAVPDGDEHDKDIALGIRYAVDNGAQIINMSFGKGFSPEKKWVDEAVEYAKSKGVLLVHAAGNDGNNIDTSWNFPNPVYKKTGLKATNWITVGASGDPKTGGLAAGFSNYGKNEVDVFAPGVRIYSTLPGGNMYGNLQGTSMASPVVAGLAAFILSYYPDLSAEQLKYVIEKSAVLSDLKVKKPGSDELVMLADISKTGGVVNAYEAIKLASSLKGERNNNKNLKAF